MVDNSESTFKKKPKPALRLNTKQKTFDDDTVFVSQSDSNTYVIQNHPIITDLTDSASSTTKKMGKNFFVGQEFTRLAEDNSSLGEYHYLVQRSNGKEMQDTCKIKLKNDECKLSIFGVFDGHSTDMIAQLLAKNLDEYIIQNYKSSKDLKTSITDAFKEIEKVVINELEAWKPRGGSTALCGVIDGKTFHVANLGDSQAVLFKDNSFVCLSNLHDLKNKSELLQVEEKGGTILNNRIDGELALTRSIGDINFKKFMSSIPEIHEYELGEKDEYIFMASDGFWNGLGPAQTLEKINQLKKTYIHDSIELQVMGDFLMDEACRNIKTKKDNMSLIIINVAEMLSKLDKDQKEK